MFSRLKMLTGFVSVYANKRISAHFKKSDGWVLCTLNYFCMVSPLTSTHAVIHGSLKMKTKSLLHVAMVSILREALGTANNST